MAWNKDTGPVNRSIKEERRERITSYSDHKEQRCEDVVMDRFQNNIFKLVFFCNFSRFGEIFIHWYQVYKYWCTALHVHYIYVVLNLHIFVIFRGVFTSSDYRLFANNEL
jgi:hypothetical protein